MRTIAAGKFKATCLAVMDEVQARRETVVITKNGKPVAKMVPVDVEEDPLFGFFKGKIEILGDIVAPMYTDEELEEMEAESMKVFER